MMLLELNLRHLLNVKSPKLTNVYFLYFVVSFLGKKIIVVIDFVMNHKLNFFYLIVLNSSAYVPKNFLFENRIKLNILNIYQFIE
jgi:hypothetical protein